MNNWKAAPLHHLLAQYVECYWFLEKGPADALSPFPKLNPDPCAHLIVADSQQPYHYHYGDVVFEGRGSHWIAPHSQTFVIDHSQPFTIVGVKFKTGTPYILKTKMQATIDQVVGLAGLDWVKRDATADFERIIKPPIFAERLSVQLDELLLPYFLTVREDKHSHLVRRALVLLKSKPVAQIGDDLHCSQRTIERSFLRVTGLTLKQYQSMIRLEDIVNDLYGMAAQDIDWASVAAKYDFSDQPHLIRHLKKAIGVTPGEYAKARDLTIDVYGDFE